MTARLPSLADFEAFRAWRADASRWLPVALEIARSHGLKAAAPHIFSTGTNLVVGLDDELILKIFPPMYRGQFVSERRSLRQLRGRLTIPIPEIVFEGESDQWPYLVITRLPGIIGSEAWPALQEDQKERVLAEIGATIAEVQRVPVGELIAHRAALGPASSQAKSTDAARGTHVSACRKNFWMDWTTFFATQPRSSRWTSRR